MIGHGLARWRKRCATAGVVGVLGSSALAGAALAPVSADASGSGASTSRVSVSTAGVEANSESVYPAISRGGRYVAFYSFASNLVPGDTNNNYDVFVRDRVDRVTRRVSVGPGGRQANFGGSAPAISRGGRHVAFGSYASNLVPGDTNGVSDVFVWDGFGDVARGTTNRPAR